MPKDGLQLTLIRAGKGLIFRKETERLTNMLNGYEIILILTLALIFFGAKKLPELARGLGKGIKEFKRASREVTDEIEHMVDAETYPPKRIPPAPTTPEHPVSDASVPPVTQEIAKPHGS